MSRAGASAFDPLFRTMFERSRAVQLITDPADGAIVDANPAASDYYGYPLAALTGLKITDINTLDAEDVRAEMVRAASDGRPYFRFRHRLASGEVRDVEVHSSPIDVEGRPLLYSIVHDTTERARAEELLRQSEARYRLLAENAHDLIVLIDGDGKFLYVSPSHARVLGYEPKALEGTRAFDLIHPEDLPGQQAAFRERLETGRSTSSVQRLRHKDGSWVWIESVGVPIAGGGGKSSVMVVTGRDVSERKRAEAALRETGEKYRTLVEGSLAGVYIIQDDIFVYVNPRMAEIFGYRPEELVGRDALELSAPADRQLVAGSLARPFGAQPDSVHYAFRGVHRDGREIDLEALCSQIEYEGRPAFAGTLLDVTERNRSEKLRGALYRIASETASTEDLPQLFGAVHRIVAELMDARNFYVALLDPAAEVIRFPYFVDEHDASPGELPLGRGLTDYLLRTGRALLASPEEADALVRAGEVEMLGSPSVDWLGVPLKSGSRTIGAIVVQSYDPAHRFGEREKELLTFVSQHVAAAIETKRAEEQVRHLAFHDVLTDLPNRLLFHDRLTLAVARAHRSGGHLAVVFLDVDRFKVINDSLGHSVGDDLLRAIARRTTRLLRQGDTLARLGGDEFILLLPEIGDVADAVRVAGKILQSFRQPFDARGQELYITASAGVSVYPFDGTDAETLVKNADIAMYRAKEQGRDNFQLYTTELNVRAQARMKIESELRLALRRDEYFLMYQPRVELATGSVSGLEALVYWRRADGAVVPPAEFIPVAEETGLILPLGAWVLRRACRQIREWRTGGAPPVPVSVDLSARQFHQQDLVDQVAGILRGFDLEPRWIDLEITETILMAHADQALATLNRLKRVGVRLTIDDFGSGYSSLAYLRRYPLDALKIARAFVHGLGGEGIDGAVVRAVVTLAHGIGLRVTAEGVESEEQRAHLRALGCDAMQGLLAGPPVGPEAIPGLLTGGGTRA